jgi:isopenicillin N synthase-like dioxygenase
VISPLGVDRYSMPFFAEPHPDTRIECLPGCQDEQQAAKYPATTCAQFLLSRFADTYAYRREQEAVE